MHTRTVILSKSLNLTIQEATDLARTLGHPDVRFVSARSSSRQGPRVAAARLFNRRGTQFIRRDRVTEEKP